MRHILLRVLLVLLMVAAGNGGVAQATAGGDRGTGASQGRLLPDGGASRLTGPPAGASRLPWWLPLPPPGPYFFGGVPYPFGAPPVFWPYWGVPAGLPPVGLPPVALPPAPPLFGLGGWRGAPLPPWSVRPSSLPRGGHRVIVFVQGVATTLTTGTFDGLAARLSQPRWGYHADTDFLVYSYNGGSMQGGRWQPEPYACDTTFQDVDLSVDRLYRMLQAYHAAHPTTQFTLVAHSLGGIVSTRLLDRLAADPALAASVEAIVTNDSPVGGFARDNINVVFGAISDAVPSAPAEYKEAWCGIENDPFALTIVNQVAGMADDPQTARDNAGRAQWAAAANIRLATRGSDTDCLFNPTVCLGAGRDQAATQHIPGSRGRLYHGLSQVPATCREAFIQCVIATHNAILQAVSPPFGTQDTLGEILDLIGPQR